MRATDRFADLVQRSPEQLGGRLDEVALLIAAHARPHDAALDVDAYLEHLDSLAARCADPTADAVLGLLFVTEQFFGDTETYYDPRNSYFDEVLDRRRGIPITLSLVVTEIGRRVGVPFEPIGMPGHFLVRHGGMLYDPFEGGRPLTVGECEARFHSIYGPAVPFDVALLEPAAPHEIVARMLNNLRQIHLSNRDRAALEWVLKLRGLLPGASLEERAERAGVLAALGRPDEAADLLEALAPEAGNDRGQVLRSKAKQLRARLN